MSTLMTTGDSSGMWRREISNCPGHLLPREFTQNAIDEVNGRTVNAKWFDIKIGPAQKLAFFNDAPGMTLKELEKYATTMSWSGKNKSSDINGNFGIGSRMAGLKSNPCGLRTYTRVKGSPMLYAEIGLNANDFAVCLVEAQEVKDCPIANFVEGTLTIFIGKDTKQNTAKNHWLGAQPGTTAVKNELTFRYWDYPGNFALRMTGGLNKRHGKSVDKMMSLKQYVVKNNASYDAVAVNKDMTIHYALMTAGKKLSINGVAVGAVGGVVYQNEVYDCAKGADWRDEAGRYGLPPGVAEKVWVVVELSDKNQFSPDSFRERLLWDDNHVEAMRKTHSGQFRPGYIKTKRHVQLRNFAKEIMANAPQWLKKLIEAEKADRDEAFRKEQEKEFKELLKTLYEPITKLVEDDSGDVSGGDDDGVFPIRPYNPKPGPEPKPEPTPEPTPKPEPVLPGLVVIEGGNKTAKPRKVKLQLPIAIYDRTKEAGKFPVYLGEDSETGADTLILNANFRWFVTMEKNHRSLLQGLSDDVYKEAYKKAIEDVAPLLFGLHFAILEVMTAHCTKFGDDERAKALDSSQFATILGTAYVPLKDAMEKHLKQLAKAKTFSADVG